MNELKAFIGCKIIQATPMTKHDFEKKRERPCGSSENQEGYLVIYPDGYESWSPKEVFENAYREITLGEKQLIK